MAPPAAQQTLSAQSWINEAEIKSQQETRDQPWKRLCGDAVDTGMKDSTKADNILMLNPVQHERLLASLVEI